MTKSKRKFKLPYEQAKTIAEYYSEKDMDETGLKNFIWIHAPKELKDKMDYPELLRVYHSVLGVAENIVNPKPKKQKPVVIPNTTQINQSPRVPHRKISRVEQLSLGIGFR